MDSEQRKKLSQLAGASIEIESASSEEAPKESVVNPEEVVTARQTWQQPWIKALVISSGVFGVVAFLGGMAFNAVNSLNMSSDKKVAVTASPTPYDDRDGENQAQDKVAVALTSQKTELTNLNSRPTQQETPQPTPTITALKEPKPYAKQEPIIKTQSNPIPSVPRLVKVVRDLPRVLPQKIERSFAAPSSPKIKSTPLNPMLQWKIAANAGNYSSSKVNSELKTNFVNSDLEIGQFKKRFSQTQTTDENSRRVLIGSRALGQLENPVAWSSDRGQNQNQNCLIKLSSPIKANDGSSVIPIGSYIVAKLTNTGESGLVQMSVTSAYINENGRTTEKQIPENSILILGKNSQPLRAETHKGSSLGSDVTASILSGVSKGAEIINQPKNQSSITSINGFSSVTSDSQRDIGAGLIQGGTQEMVRRMQSTSERILQSQANSKLFVVAAKTPVEIFVNQSFNL